MANYSLILMISLMLSVNIGLALFDGAVQSYNPAHTSSINYTSSPVASISFGGDFYTGVNLSESLALPTISESVDATTGSNYVDPYKTTSNWIEKINSVLGFTKSMVSQPMKMLRDIGVPQVYTFAFGVLWYVIFLFLIVSFIKGSGAD